MKTLFKNARILTMVDDKVIEGELLVIDTRIAYIGKDASEYAPFDKVVDCQGNLLMPGLKNAHTHSAMIFLRNRFHDVSLQDWLFKCVFPREAKLIPSDIYYLDKACFLEYFANGTTACFDHYFFPPEGAKAAEEMGMRVRLLSEIKTVEELVNLYHLYNDKKEAFARYAIGVHAEYTSDEEKLNKTKEVINRLKCPFFTHISETKKEVEECIGRHNMPPLKYLFTKGLYEYGGGGYHCIHFTDEEVEICKKNNLFIVSCPGSNQYLSSGIAPLSNYLKEGIIIALGTDGPASNESLDMFREMRLAATLENKDISPFEVLKMATVNGALAMELYDSDVLAKGKYADIIMIDLSKPNMKETDNLLYNLVHKCNENNVTMTMINGKIVYQNGEYFINESVEEIKRQAEEACQRIEKCL